MSESEISRIDKVKQNIKETEERFKNERETWKERVFELAGMFNSINTVAELQIELHRSLQEVIDYKAYLQGLVIKKSSHIRKLKLAVIDKYSNSNVRYTASEKQQTMEGTITLDLKHLEILEMILDYYEDLSKTLHGMTYQIQHRIKLEEISTNYTG